MNKKNIIDYIIDFLRKYKFLSYIINIFDKYREVILYLFFGALTTLVNILSYLILTKLLNVNYLISNVFSWIISVIFAFVTNKIYVFNSTQNIKKTLFKEITYFFLYRVISLIIDMIIMYLGYDILSFNDLLVKIVSNIIVIVLNYIFSKFIIFKNNTK